MKNINKENIDNLLSKYKRIIVAWVDPTSRSCWSCISEVKEFDTTLCLSSAFLIYEDKENIKIAMTVSSKMDFDGEDGVAEVLVIPKGCIVWREG